MDEEKVNTWLARPEARIGTGGKVEIIDLLEEEMERSEPDPGKIVALCARRALREDEGLHEDFPYTRVELSKTACKGALRIDPDELLKTRVVQEWMLALAWSTTSKHTALNSVVTDCIISPTIENLTRVIALVLALGL